jgi:predicted anti-sigma-YlaC factor YlaD
MSDCSWWDRVSADVDGELADSERAATAEHLARCATCRTLLAAIGGVRATPRVSVVDDERTSFALDSGRLNPAEQRWMGGRWARRLLMVAAVVIVVEAVPGYVSGDGLEADSHTARHLAAWQIGFGVGLFVAAWVSRMSHAMLALAATFAALIVGATIIDVFEGHGGPLAEPVHLVELVGVFLLWRLTPPHLLPWSRANATTESERSDRSRRRTLELVERDAVDRDRH